MSPGAAAMFAAGATGKADRRRMNRMPAALAPARSRTRRRVFALTLVPDFFELCGFTMTSLARLPEKSAAECPVCPKRFACDEQAMLINLDGTKPEPLRPGEPWGYTRIFLGQEPAR